jgi:hypothetical protein
MSCDTTQTNQSVVNSAAVKQIIEKGNFTVLEKMSGLTSEELLILRNTGYPNQPKQYCCALLILVYGYNSINITISGLISSAVFPNALEGRITPTFYNDFVDPDHGVLRNIGLLESAKSKSPAGKAKELERKSNSSHWLRNMGGRAVTNPASGSSLNLPSWAADALNRASAEASAARAAGTQTGNTFVEDLQSVCESISTRAYLKCLSMGSFGGFQEAVAYVSGMIQNFYDALYDFYQGMKLMMLQAQLFIAQQITDLQLLFTSRFLSKRVQFFLALVCMILKAVQTLLDDIGFFASILGGSDSLFKALNAVQTVVNWGSQILDYIQNPITSLLPALFPKQALAITKFINDIGKIPDQFLGSLLKTFSAGKRMNNTALAIINTIVKRYCLGSQLGGLETVLDQFGTVGNRSKWSRGGYAGLRPHMNFFPRGHSPAEGRRFSMLTENSDGTPTLTLKGARNAVTSIFDISQNKGLQRVKEDGVAFRENAKGLWDVLTKNFKAT